MKVYVTFGQTHTHRVNGHTIDKDCVVCIEAEDHGAGRDKAFEYFGGVFCTTYDDTNLPTGFFNHFPRGVINL